MDETKYIRIEDGDYTWEFPAHLVAKDRAEYYASVDEDTSYEEEFEFTMSDDYQLRDWFLNNMNWKDVSKKARIVEQPFKLVPDLSEAEVSVFVKDR